jgi:cation diffusion facilitator CzcD-associated flavoprotein CzcO
VAFDGFAISLADGGVVSARTIVAACGARYRRPPLANWGRLEGAGIYYAATYLEAGLSADSPVFVLGGGNSAGQAALFLASRCPHVTIVIRRESLAATMSQYLIDRIEAHDQIDVAVSSVISAVNGLRHLESVELPIPGRAKSRCSTAAGYSASSARSQRAAGCRRRLVRHPLRPPVPGAPPRPRLSWPRGPRVNSSQDTTR